MAKFTRGVPVETTRPTVVVDAGLPPGRHRFRLVVVDEDGNRSAPAVVEVRVRERPGPPGGGLFRRLFGGGPG